MTSRPGWIGAALVAVLLAGCGPVHYAADLIDAEAALEDARAAHARWHAPYEFHAADAYLSEAKQQSAIGDYEDAIRYARTAAEFAKRAARVAAARAGQESP